MENKKMIITTYENGTVIEYKNASRFAEAMGVSRQWISLMLKQGSWVEKGIIKIERAGNVYGDGVLSKQWWYGRYRAMKARCYNPEHPAYESYGAKGVYVCDEWLENPWAYGKWVEEQRIKLGVAVEDARPYEVDKDVSALGYYGPDACAFINKHENVSHAHKGKTTSEETKEKQRKNQPNRRIIKCVETGEVFPSAKACAEAMGLCQPSVSRVLNGKQASASGYTFVEVA